MNIVKQNNIYYLLFSASLTQRKEIIIYSLGYNKIPSKGAIILFDVLNKHKSTISHIYLNENQIDDECMESLGNYIHTQVLLQYQN